MERREKGLGETDQGVLFTERDRDWEALCCYCNEPQQLYSEAAEGYREIAIDTETNGLEWWNGHRPFCVTVYNGKTKYFFDVREKDQIQIVREALNSLDVKYKDLIFIFANAKFDLHMIGITLRNRICDVLVQDRLIYNEHMSYSLKSVAERYGHKKDDSVEKYISKNKLYDLKEKGGKGYQSKSPRYDLVPLHILAPYAVNDCVITWEIFQKQKEKLVGLEKIAKLESDLIIPLMMMEFSGIKIDVEYCKKAIQYGMQEMHKYAQKFEELTNFKYVDTAAWLQNVFSTKYGITLPKTEKGNTEISEDTLLSIKNSQPDGSVVLEVIDCILNIRDHYKRTYTYFSPYLSLVDSRGNIHSSFRQHGTKTGRMSMSNPNFQNLSKRGDKKAVYPVRKCVIAPEGFTLVSIDYKAFEFCAALDYADELELAKQIQAGADPHQATAEMVGLERDDSKKVTFGILYGEGIHTLAKQLNKTPEQARQIRSKYFNNLPNMQNLIDKVTQTAKKRGFIFNKFGRRSYFPDHNFAYKAINSLIQGVTADAVKTAIIEIDKVQSGLILQVHDELLFCVEDYEVDELLHTVLPIMKDAYPVKDPAYKMQCSVSVGKNWGDMQPYTYNESHESDLHLRPHG